MKLMFKWALEKPGIEIEMSPRSIQKNGLKPVTQTSPSLREQVEKRNRHMPQEKEMLTENVFWNIIFFVKN